MDCPEPIMIRTPDLKTKKSRKFNSKDEQGKEHEIEIGVTNESIIFKSEINNGIITREEAIKAFDIARCGKSPSRFDFEKLKNINLHYIKQLPDEVLFRMIEKRLQSL